MEKSNDPYLSDLYERIHDTPMQRKLRRLAPMPVGCVFLPWPGMTEAEARQHFRLMKQLGFTCLKQTMATAEWPVEKTLLLALEEGIIPFWYAEGGYEDITPQLLKRLGLPEDMPIDEALEHPRVVAHQHEIIRRRVLRRAAPAPEPATPAEKKDITWVPGVVGQIKGHELHPDSLPYFIGWLKETYGTIEHLKEAWNYRHVGLDGEMRDWKTWDDVLATLKEGMHGREYRHLRDMLRFRADMFTRQYVVDRARKAHETDPDEPTRNGGEMGLFLSFASRGTDMEQMAEALAPYGSFYPSIHLAWHFEEVNFEVARPVYMQAQLAADWAKGLWSATWESTGGPQYFSGGKSPFVEETRNTTPGFTTNERTMTQLMLSYLAAGFRGFGLWAWNARTAGWEAGEYPLLDRNRNVTERARRVGRIGQAARRWRRELWQCRKEPLVGVLQDWENEAMWAAMAVTGRDKYKAEPVRARIGASRAFINANVPWEYVTARNLKAGLGPRYRCIYMPAFICITSELMQHLLQYVEQGGRLVLDMPGAYYDEFGRVFRTDEGSAFEKLFGAVLHEFAYANNEPYRIGELEAEGFTCVLSCTRAKVATPFHNGLPAITECATGKGTAVILANQASLNCWRPGNDRLEALITRTTLGDLVPPYACEGALVYRQAGKAADHYFLINDGPARSVVLQTRACRYRGVMDAVTGQELQLGAPIDLEPHGGRWLRFEKA